MKASATDILRRHCQERRLRRAVRAIDIEREPMAMPLLSAEAWVDSLQLVTGVPEAVLEMMTAFYTDDGETEWTTVLVEVQGQEAELRKEQVCVPIRLTEAARRAGLGDLTHKQARALQLEAIGTINDNLVRRASREER
jgi:hypothetical protein